MNYQEIIAYLFNSTPVFEQIGAKAYKDDLHDTRILDEHFQHPHKNYKTIHVAGTNGKGSCSHSLAALLQAKGYKVGLYTSPHIKDFRERIRVNSACISEQYVVDFVEKERTFFEPLHPSFFELTTAMALKYFADEHVDIAVIEVGLGGCLDCTNIITPILSIITNISFDHTQFLGNTLASIAAEKAGIIKPGIPVVVGNIELKALRVIWEVARKNTARVYQFPYDYRTEVEEHEHFNFFSGQEAILDIEKSLVGLHQIENAGMAIELSLVYAIKVGIELTEDVIRSGIREAFWPARMEKLGEKPLILLDGAHNVHAMNRLLENLSSEFPDKKITIIFSAITTKDISQMIKMLQTVKNSHLILTTFDYPKALNLGDFQNLEEEGVELAPSWELTLVRAQKNLAEDDLLLVTGSLYFSSQVREFLKKEK